MQDYLDNYLEEFKVWLGVLGYSKRSIIAYEVHAKELLLYVANERRGLTEKVLIDYVEYIQNRPNERRSGGLSGITVVMKLRVLKLFLEYLVLMKDKPLHIKIPVLEVEQNPRLALSEKQISKLYKILNAGKNKLEDRVIMCLYYGCGLRRSEGLKVKLQDVLLTRKLLYVENGKGGKSRYVPLNLYQVKDLKNYIYDRRTKSKSSILLLNKLGDPMSGNGVSGRLKRWALKAEIKQPVSLHILRHSIATHLLNNGMRLSSVSQFLGHSSLVSTQRYTHVKALRAYGKN